MPSGQHRSSLHHVNRNSDMAYNVNILYGCDDFMKRSYSIILVMILSVGILNGGIIKYTNQESKAYAALSISVNRAGTNAVDLNGNSDIAPIRKNSSKKSAEPDKETPKTKIDLNKIKNSGVINIAFFGLDRRNSNESSRSDSIMVVSIDEKKQKIKVTSLMRDMYVAIPGKGKNRINSAYAYGGASLALKTINTNFGLDIKHYVTVDFFGLEKLIDSIGGVNVYVSDAEAKDLNNGINEINDITGIKVPEVKGGNQTLNGRQAVAYCRIRYVGNGDYERTERQRRVLNEILRKLKQNGIKQLPKTISTVLPYVKTSLSTGEILKLGIKGIGFKTDSITQYRLPVDGTYKSQNISGMAVLVPNIEVNKEKIYEFIYEK